MTAIIECTFCGETGPRSAEDVFPRWLQDKLGYFARQLHPDEDPKYVNYAYEDEEAFRQDTADRSTSRALEQFHSGARPATQFKLPDVCVTCNGGWMSRLEVGAQHLLPGLIEGKAKFLDPYDQIVLSTWMTKTCLAYDAFVEPRWVPASVGSRRFYARGRPLPATRIAVGHDPDHTPEGVLAHGRKHFHVPQSPAPDIYAVLFSFQFDHLLIKAIINYGEHLSDEFAIGVELPVEPPYWQQVWPPHVRFRWPSDAARTTAKDAPPDAP